MFGLVATGAIAILGWLATELFFTFVYGQAYAPAVGIASLLMVAGALTGFNLWAGELARSGGRMWLPAMAEFPSVLVFLFVLLTWKSSWGAPKAAAVGSLAGYATTAAIYVVGLVAMSFDHVPKDVASSHDS
jgi:O-antigen/teichoic acid export membrane protein